MITRRVSLEIDVPIGCAAVTVLVVASGALTKLGIRNQARICWSQKDERDSLPELAKSV